MEWPPMTLHFASAIFERPPRIICSRISGSPLSGKPTIDSAEIGLPPMAYTSLSEFAAAICPNVNGSSTMGVKKSTVCTSAISRLSRYTPASSLVSKPTSTFGSVGRGKRRKTESSNPGLSFAAQPAALTMAVSFTEWVKPHLAVKPFDYSEVPRLVLAHQATFVVPRFPVARLPSIRSISWEARFPTVIRQGRQFPKAGASAVQNGTVLRLGLSHRIQLRISDLTANGCSLSPLLRAVSLQGSLFAACRCPALRTKRRPEAFGG